MRGTIVRTTVALSACALAAGCATTSVQADLELPPRSQEMQEAQSVMVLDFDGERGPEAQRKIRMAINKGKLHDLYDGDSRIRQQQLETLVSEGQDDKLADSAPEGATMLISGSALEDDYRSEVERNDYEKCVRKNKDGKCTRKKTVRRFTRHETCRGGVHFRVLRVADGRAAVERTLEHTLRVSNAQDNKPPRSNQRQLCDQAFDGAVDKTIAYVTPYRTKVTLKFRDIEDDGSTERATERMKMSRVDEAKSLLESVLSLPGLEEEDRAWARYNLSVALWAAADFDGCLEQIDQAQSVLGADSDLMEMDKACREYVQ